jgi:hypothetical protein
LYSIVPVLHIGTEGSIRIREWAVMKKDWASKSIYRIPENRKYVKYGKYGQYAQYARYLPACHQLKHQNNVEIHIHNV